MKPRYLTTAFLNGGKCDSVHHRRESGLGKKISPWPVPDHETAHAAMRRFVAGKATCYLNGKHLPGVSW
ncbi:hypothetical protein [Ferrovibrio sp.]|uniref:hypothetical protein n=1 Tax=Ferrovibrio sp. TaxID=1917215 RepID=UPI003D29BCF1